MARPRRPAAGDERDAPRRPRCASVDSSWVAMQHGHADLVEVDEQVDDLARGLGVEVGGRFVGEQDRRAVDDGARDAQALLLAARERDRIGLFARQQAHLVERRARTRAPLLRLRRR